MNPKGINNKKSQIGSQYAMKECGEIEV